jgi:ferrochelatase
VSFRTEPDYQHGSAPRTAVLLVNLGSPDEPTAAATRRYLKEFLSDPRVVEIPRALWWLILNGVVLRTRPAQSAAKYASVWMPEGSPLVVGTRRLAIQLQGWLGEAGLPVLVEPAMRYGNPSVASALDKLRAQGATRVLVLPLYPQYSATTTASVFDAVAKWALQARHVPEWRFINRYGDAPEHIEALARSVREHWQAEGRSPMLVMSFHGLPERYLHMGDPYHCECHKTARLLAEALQLAREEYRVTFQSRFGKAQWLRPYTEPTLQELARAGHRRVDVICPGFAVDCLETLEEIDQEAREAYLAAGGEQFHYIPCLNDRPDGVRALRQLVQQHLAGWPVLPAHAPPEVAAQRKRALAMGATQ